MRLLRILFLTLAGVLLVLVLAIGGVVVALNSAPGRAFAEHKLNALLGPDIRITGLAGHFPADIKLAGLSLADAQGVWLRGGGLELRWRPEKLLQRDVDVALLRADTLDVLRRPLPGGKTGKSSSGLPKNLHLELDALAVPRLDLAAPVLGEAAVLKVAGSARAASDATGSLTLHATAGDGAAYDLAAGIGRSTVTATARISEPPGGLIGHFAGSRLRVPLSLALNLAGPRDDAAVNFAAQLGGAAATGAGALGLVPGHLHADMVLDVPELGPLAAFAHEQLAGGTKVHLVAAQQGLAETLALDGTLAISRMPKGIPNLVGPKGAFSLQATLSGQDINIQQLDVSGQDFAAALAGSVAQGGEVDLNTHLLLNNVAAVSPGISGSAAEDGTIIGTAKDFGLNAVLTGDIAEKKIPSGPFSIVINAQHLPGKPVGTVTGSGALENYPLLLDAEFAVDAEGTANILIHNALWRSLSATANLTLAKGETLPTGTADFAIGNLGDFSAFSPVRLAGSLRGDFAHPGGQVLKLDLFAGDILALPQFGRIDGKISALGPPDAVRLSLEASIAKMMGAPARLALSGVVNMLARSGTLETLAANWKTLDARLLGPAGFATKPGITVRHLALGLNGGRIGVDGTLTPALNARFTANNLPLALGQVVSPSLQASGTLSAEAALTGNPRTPAGTLTVAADGVKLPSGKALGLPAANFSASATLDGHAGNMRASLAAGPDIALNISGEVPEQVTGPINLGLQGKLDLRLLDPVLAAQGTVARGELAADIRVTGSAAAPAATGTATLAGGSLENIASGLNLTAISAHLLADGQTLTLAQLGATAGGGTISGHGTVGLKNPMPVDLTLEAHHATPISSDIATETVDATLHLTGQARGRMALDGQVKLDTANINIPHNLPPSVANLPILYPGEKPPPPPAPAPDVALNLAISAPNKIFIRGDGLFAELGGRLGIAGTARNPVPSGGFSLIRGSFSLAGTNLQFTSGTITFTGDGFMPALDLEATSVTSDNNATATLVVGGTAAHPTITLTSSPPLPSDEILAQLLFGQNTASLTPFQAASLAAALAQLSGVGGGANPLDTVRNALGLDQLSIGGSGSGPPSVNAGRYVAPGVYVGASQATNGTGTQATVQVNLTKGLKLTTSTGNSSTGAGTSSSVGLTYQFNY